MSGNSHEGKPGKNPLKLVSERSPEQVTVFNKLQKIAASELTAGTFQNVLAHRKDLLQYYLRVEGITDPEVAAARAQELILKVLLEKDRTIKVSKLPIQELERISQHLGINVAVQDWLETQGLELADISKLPDKNIEKYVKEFKDIIWTLAGILSHREELEEELREKGVDIRNQDVTRLLVYDLNKDLVLPKILVLPNDYKPYNPYLVMLIGDAKLSAEIMRLLLCFNR